jgi:hypothetical protein
MGFSMNAITMYIIRNRSYIYYISKINCTTKYTTNLKEAQIDLVKGKAITLR